MDSQSEVYAAVLRRNGVAMTGARRRGGVRGLRERSNVPARPRPTWLLRLEAAGVDQWNIA
jgi:hypothetical protein